jgi:hypothetical protein
MKPLRELQSWRGRPQPQDADARPAVERLTGSLCASIANSPALGLCQTYSRVKTCRTCSALHLPLPRRVGFRAHLGPRRGCPDAHAVIPQTGGMQGKTVNDAVVLIVGPAHQRPAREPAPPQAAEFTPIVGGNTEVEPGRLEAVLELPTTLGGAAAPTWIRRQHRSRTPGQRSQR